MKKTVALIFGGEGCEREISRLSAKNLAELIDKTKYELIFIHIDEGGGWHFADKAEFQSLNNTFPAKLGEESGFISKNGLIKTDCAIPCLHGDFGEDGVIQGALTAAHIPYIGQDVFASAITADKAYTKLMAEHIGIPTANYIVCSESDPYNARLAAEKNLSYPMFIKPARLGSSFGASPVYCEGEFISAYNSAKAYSDKILIEELVEFEYELECAYFNDGAPLVSVGGRVLSGGKFYDFGAKYKGDNSPKTEVGSGKSPAVEKMAREYTLALAEAVGICHISRLDFFVDKDGNLYFNEINSFPGMTDTSLYPRLTVDAGLKSGEFINRLIAAVCSDDRSI